MTRTTCCEGPLAAFVGLLACSCVPLHDLDRISSRHGKGSGDSGIRDAHGTALDGAGLSRGRNDASSPCWDADIPSISSEASGCPPCAMAVDAAPAGSVAPDSAERSREDSSSGQVDSSSSDSPEFVPDSDRVVPAVEDSGLDRGHDALADSRSTALIAEDLPDIDNSPIRGVVTFITNSAWGQWPAFEIKTPTARYFLLKSQAAIVSIIDSAGVQWINFSSDYRPNRGVPNLGGCCQPGAATGPGMSTVLDPSMTVTSTHVRFISKSADASTWLVWDFFLTHFTLTINRSAKAFGFTYQGTPGEALGLLDRVVFSDGTSRSILVPRSKDLPGPAEWAYFTHLVGNHSLFLIQHSDDDLAENYRIVDGDTAMLKFGSGGITQAPIRFSLGLIDSCDAQTVRKRIEFVRDAIR